MAQYDIHFQPVPSSDVRGYRCVEFGFAAALKVTGFQSLVNRWLKTFLTPLGSDLLDPEAGTGFGFLMESNMGEVNGDVRDAVELAVQDANEQVQDQDLEGLFPEDERLASADIVTYNEVPAGFEVWVRIENEAGTALTVLAATIPAE